MYTSHSMGLGSTCRLPQQGDVVPLPLLVPLTVKRIRLVSLSLKEWHPRVRALALPRGLLVVGVLAHVLRVPRVGPLLRVPVVRVAHHLGAAGEGPTEWRKCL